MKKYLLALGALFLLNPILSQAVEEGDLLAPEQAFALTAKAIDAKTIELRYQIANGYYLYHDKFKFQVDPTAVGLGAAKIPAGKVKQDEFFGRVETHRGQLIIKLPIAHASAEMTLKAVSQGCADLGVCYPPYTHTIKVGLAGAAAAKPAAAAPVASAPEPVPAALPPPAAPAKASGALAALKDFGVSLGGGDELLPAEEAFKVSLKNKDANTLLLTITPSANVYMYRDKIKATLLDGNGISIASVNLPQGEEKADPSFGKTQVYHHAVTAEINLKRETGAAQKIALRIDYQGCNEKVGVCYPPLHKRFDLNLPSGPVAAIANTPDNAQPKAESGASAMPSVALATPEAKTEETPAAAASQDDSSKVAALFKGSSFWVIIASFFGFGLLLALTPCVFPMIPILSGIIVGQGKQITHMQGFVLSLAYVLGMAITYAIAGVIAGLSGALISTALQNPWVLGTFALIFVALSFSMFGFYELQMPNFIQSRFTEASNKLKGGNLIGVFIMGMLSAVIVGPCVAAPLAGALFYIGQTKDVWLGGWALFTMALGMGVPLLLVGVAGGALLPRAGGWMNAVKSFFGVMLLAVAIWLISPVISALALMLLSATLLIVSAIYLHALDPLPLNAAGFKKFWKGIGVIALVVGAALAIGALSGGRDILQPLAGLRASVGTSGNATAAEAAHGLSFERVKSVAELDARIAASKGKAVMLDFYADWCVSCKEMERFTFTDPKVQARLKDVLLLQANVTDNNDADKALLKRFGLFGPPGMIFFDKNGVEQKYRVIGYEKTDKFLQSINSALK